MQVAGAVVRQWAKNAYRCQFDLAGLTNRGSCGTLWSGSVFRSEKGTKMVMSFLDNDTYKFSMCQAILHGEHLGIKLADREVTYRLIFRDPIDINLEFCNEISDHINRMADLRLTPREVSFLRTKCRFLDPHFIDILSAYRFDPGEVEECGVGNDGSLRLSVSGPWWRTVLWEVPLMAIISETYFSMRGLKPDAEWRDRLKEKAELFDKNNVSLVDFGTRRRFSYDVHDEVITMLMKNMKPKNLVGTSNLHFAHKYNLRPIGTHAHEWFMGIGALFGYKIANRLALTLWKQEFGSDLSIALSDTFTSDVFLRDFDRHMADSFQGVRQDSGEPTTFANKMISHYIWLGIDPKTKTIVFSDGLTTKMAKFLNDAYSGLIGCMFGIGTHLTNDCGHKPLNMVIKLMEIADLNEKAIPCIKLSDSVGKYTGDTDEVQLCRQVLRIRGQT